ncbi:PKD domain-containing protein [Brachybacterium squillarum]|uniref:PKD domain-containing protein n=1 Tax=Brachybacterium squillarum TaxID=661979 RepID=UPI000262975E|nr:PKD domain-containing protein [Brachybacterium squillarum]
MHDSPRDHETRDPVPPRPQALRSALALTLLGALVLATSVLGPGVSPPAGADEGVPPLLQRDENVVTADALPTVQIDEGYVWAQTMIGDTVYAVGGFDNARAPRADPGTWLTPRTNALAYDITTGDLDQNFAPEVNGPVKAVAASPDGSRIYIGGSFNRVNGESRWGIAALDPVTGEVLDDFRPAIGGTGVYSLVADGDTVYAGGLFTQANGAARRNAAAFAEQDGALRAWAPEPDRQIDAMVADPAGEDIVLGGRFTAVNGDGSLKGIGAVHRTTGEVDTDWVLPETVESGALATARGQAGIFALAADEGAVYGTGWAFWDQERKLEGTFAAEAGTGELRWVADCHGDHYGVFSSGETVYTTGHTHSCETVGLAPEQDPRENRYVEAFTTEARGVVAESDVSGYKNWGGSPAPSPYVWYPDFLVGTATGLGQAGLTITGNDEYIAVAGEFVGVNDGNYQGIVRFATDPEGGAADGPRIGGEDWQPVANPGIPGRTRLTIPGTWDRDDLTLTYELWREDLDDPVDTVVADSTWWEQPEIGLEDTTAEPGTTHTYTVRARDGDGNEVSSAGIDLQAEEGETPSYTAAVLEDDPLLYYPLGDTEAAWAGTDPALFGAGVAPGQDGISNSATGPSGLDGGSDATIGENGATGPAPEEWSAEVWVRTETTTGGKLLGFGDRSSGTSLTYDRQVYMTDAGTLRFGTYPNGTTHTIGTEESFNDGQWHHVVASQGADGMTLTVDGQVLATDPDVTGADDREGSWRFGGDSVNGWPDRPSTDFLTGDLDEAAVYDRVLPRDRIAEHYRLGRVWEAPTAAFTEQASGLAVQLDASSSTADEGAEIVSWDWDLGDGTTAEGETVEHTYGAAGTYPVTLTVTDDQGGSHSVTEQVTVEHAAPAAAFEATATGRELAVDASGTELFDDAEAEYVWDFGDGSTGEGVTAEHTYAEDGTYTVTLTVTDSYGATSEATTEVEVSRGEVVVSDSFEREATGSWGTADTGGDWTLAGGTPIAASVSGGAGVLTLPPGSGRTMTLPSVQARDTASEVSYTLSPGPDAGSLYAGTVARSTAEGNYRALVWHRADGSMWLLIQRDGTVLSSQPLPDTWQDGDTIHLDSEVTGDGETTLRAKAWVEGQEEPEDWQLEHTVDASEALTGEGAPGVYAYRSRSGSDAAVVTVEEFEVQELASQAAEATPEEDADGADGTDGSDGGEG